MVVGQIQVFMEAVMETMVTLIIMVMEVTAVTVNSVQAMVWVMVECMEDTIEWDYLDLIIWKIDLYNMLKKAQDQLFNQ
uniref:Putative secreted protein n=1 Tax=Xenopsylla cheopis TaxID=163159 RepID=A0A6M2DVK0_XENCH